MNFCGSFDWNALMQGTAYLYDPQTGMQYQLVPVSNLSGLITDTSCFATQDQICGSLSSQDIKYGGEVQQKAPSIKETPKNSRPEPLPKLKKQPHFSGRSSHDQLKRKLERNSLTNAGNQVLIYAYMRRRCGGLIRKHFPNLSEIELREYYAFAKKVKMSMLNYISFDKLADAWLHPHLEN